MKQAIADLQRANVGKVHVNEPLADYTTWKIGGPADVIVIPTGKDQLIETVQIFNQHNVPWLQIGRGSNLLVSDKGFRGAVIKLGENFGALRYEGECVYAGGAYSFIKLSVMTAKEGLTGLEFAGGIPGTVGGAVYMNAGAHGSDVSRILLSAEIVLETGELVQWNAKDLQFAYRYSALHKIKGIVTEAVFKLKQGERKEIAAAMATYKDRRLKTQPLQLAVAGSVFRNPDNHYAAKLIQDAGLKGMRSGGAEVSRQHANFIVNTGQATARDVQNLIELIQAKVYEQYNIKLVPEVRMVGER